MQLITPAEALSSKELRSFGLIMGAMIALFFGILIPWLWGSANWPLWPWFIAALLAVWALFIPSTLMPVYKGWMKVAAVLAWINIHLILGIAFYLVILPTSLVLRVLGKDPLARKSDPSMASYRIAKTSRDPNHMEKPF